ncbi:MAG: cellulase family glycosylhydrolase, partial [Oscillospiraceae bacterium]|nr:cellulase family glycosylhydrolase [Oscillospiraceae bacterium]
MMSKKWLISKVAAVAAAAAMAASAMPIVSYAAMNTSEFEQGYSYSTEMRGLSAFQLVNDMGPGWNLGNSLESTYNETYWGNPATTKAMIDKIAAKGYTTLRVPVRWDDNYSNASTYTIDSSYMDRVETVVNYGLANDMYVILNVHHNDLQEKVPDTEAISAELSAVWTQIGARFKNYGDKLIFEVNNEPRSGNDWTGNADYYASVNDCNEAARTAIRATGGNNAERLVMLPTYCASGDADKAAGWTKNANDNMIAASIHAYLPYDFAFQADGHTDWTDSDLVELKSFFNRQYNYFISKGVPVVIGEFGTQNKNNTSARETHATIYGQLARQFAEQDIPCVVWDNNCFYTNGENFGLFDRNSQSFTFGGVAGNLIAAYEGDPVYETSVPSKTILSSGGSCSGWGQAVNLSGSIVADMTSNQQICAVFTSSNNPELILSDYGTDKNWVKINPDSVSNGVATWSYNTLYSAFGYTFDGLDNVAIGDTGASLTVTSVYMNNPNAHTHSYDGAVETTLDATPTTYGREIVHCSVSGCEAYRVKITDKKSALEIVAQPTDYEGKVGDTATFTVKAEGDNLTYQWEQDTGNGWTVINTSAARKASFSIGVTSARAKYKYRCVVSDGKNEVTSDAVKMIVNEELAITTQPTNFKGVIGDTAKFTIEATAVTSYQWQQNTGAGWTAINTTAGRSKTFSIAIAQFRLGYKYRCIVSDGTKTLTSNEVQMVVEEELAITSQPTSYKGAIGDTAKFTIGATGATSYQWYQNTGAGWTAINTTAGRSKTFSIAIAQFRLGYKYR